MNPCMFWTMSFRRSKCGSLVQVVVRNTVAHTFQERVLWMQSVFLVKFNPQSCRCPELDGCGDRAGKITLASSAGPVLGSSNLSNLFSLRFPILQHSRTCLLPNLESSFLCRMSDNRIRAAGAKILSSVLPDSQIQQLGFVHHFWPFVHVPHLLICRNCQKILVLFFVRFGAWKLQGVAPSTVAFAVARSASVTVSSAALNKQTNFVSWELHLHLEQTFKNRWSSVFEDYLSQGIAKPRPPNWNDWLKQWNVIRKKNGQKSRRLGWKRNNRLKVFRDLKIFGKETWFFCAMFCGRFVIADFSVIDCILRQN
jgi:hypothetical protein